MASLRGGLFGEERRSKNKSGLSKALLGAAGKTTVFPRDSSPKRESRRSTSASRSPQPKRKEKSRPARPEDGQEKRHREMALWKDADVKLRLPGDCEILGYKSRLQSELRAVLVQNPPLIAVRNLTQPEEGRESASSALPLEDYQEPEIRQSVHELHRKRHRRSASSRRSKGRKHEQRHADRRLSRQHKHQQHYHQQHDQHQHQQSQPRQRPRVRRLWRWRRW
eukprot:TRINITY_DN13227_c0_g1_i7.p1 TRINITY_DN13227_c0_g1~~TRINITY_DN13227_c0_g1_i7.p1  ORF type:complete len:223 (-),score=31.45 TRINITY_DN13227_c0_g1_i7:7-675(-)